MVEQLLVKLVSERRLRSARNIKSLAASYKMPPFGAASVDARRRLTARCCFYCGAALSALGLRLTQLQSLLDARRHLTTLHHHNNNPAPPLRHRLP